MNRKTWEVCPGCGGSVRIPDDKSVSCPRCGAQIRPCTACTSSDCNDCPHDAMQRREA